MTCDYCGKPMKVRFRRGKSLFACSKCAKQYDSKGFHIVPPPKPTKTKTS